MTVRRSQTLLPRLVKPISFDVSTWARRSTAALVCAVAACSKPDGVASSPVGTDSAATAITADGLLQHIKDLSADSMEGRAPGTPGEQKAVAYMEAQFKALGLKP